MTRPRPFKVSLYDPDRPGEALSEVWFETFASALRSALLHRDEGRTCGLLDRQARTVYRIAPSTPEAVIASYRQRQGQPS